MINGVVGILHSRIRSAMPISKVILASRALHCFYVHENSFVFTKKKNRSVGRVVGVSAAKNIAYRKEEGRMCHHDVMILET